MRKIFVFGNPLVGADSLALRVAERLSGKLRGVEFVAVACLDEVKERDFWGLDVATGIGKVEVIEGLERLEAVQPISGHDFDLALELKMRRKVGRLGKVRIIAVPVGYELERAAEEVKRIILKQ